MQSLWRWEVENRSSSCVLWLGSGWRKAIFNGRVTLPASSTMTTYPTGSVLDRRSTKVMITAVFTALALSTNYALIGIPNVKIMDTLVFIAPSFIGLRPGIGADACAGL